MEIKTLMVIVNLLKENKKVNPQDLSETSCFKMSFLKELHIYFPFLSKDP